MPQAGSHSFVRRGFTLVEAVCTMVVVGVLGVATSGLVLSASDQYLAAASRGAIGSGLSAAMERVAIELRQIPAAAGVSPTRADLRGVTPTSVSWNDASAVERSLALSGTQLVLSEGRNQYVLLKDVSAFSVAAFDESNVPLAGTIVIADIAPVRRLEVSITVSRGGCSETLRSRFFLRSVVEGGSP